MGLQKVFLAKFVLF